MQDMDEYYMRMALDLAENAAQAEDTPIGAIIVYQDQIIGSGYNKRNAMGDPLCHAEIGALSNVCRCHCTGEDSSGCDRSHEPKGGMCRVCIESPAASGI